MKRTFRQAARDARACLKDAAALLRENAAGAFALCALLYLLPQLLSTVSAWQVTAPLFTAWEDFLHGMAAGTATAEAFANLLLETMASSSETMLRTGLISLLSSFFLIPLLQATLARMNLAQLNAHTRITANDAATETLRSWKSLLFLAFISMIITQLLSILPYFAASILSFVSGLIGMIPGMAQIATIVGLILVMVVQAAFNFFVTLLLSFIWLTAMGEETRGMAAVVRSAQICLHRIGVVALSNLALSLAALVVSAVVSIVWCIAFFNVGAPIRVIQLAEPIVQALFVPISCALSAVLFVRAGGQGGGNGAYGAPDHLRSIKSANIPDGRE